MNYGIPYMGSKSTVAASIALNFPEAENFYDLFGGGFSMTHYLLKHKRHKFKNFYFNEIEKSVVQLIKDSIAGKYNYDVYTPEWISRDEFFKRKDSDPYVRVCWPFFVIIRNMNMFSPGNCAI